MIIGLYSPRPQCGKSTVAAMLCEGGGHRVPFAGTLKAMARPLLAAFGYSREEVLRIEQGDKTEVIGPLGVTVRKIYQTLGTEWGREHIHQDLWLKAWTAKVCRIPAEELVVVEDVRFLNEAALIKKLGGEVWQITRPGAGVESTPHPSENALRDWQGFSAVISNSGSLDTLRESVAWAQAGRLRRSVARFDEQLGG
jgi:hypothetical protein